MAMGRARAFPTALGLPTGAPGGGTKARKGPALASESIENYLKAIYKLETREGPATTGEIARRLGVSAPSVSRMVKKLAREQLVALSPYQGARLTERGRRQALRIVRNHRILESYLVHVLGMSWDVVDAEVERLEHVVSEQLIDRMDAALGYPRFDPHGSPIPSRNGDLPEPTDGMSLVELGAGRSARVSRVADAMPDALSYLATLGVTPGAELAMLRQEPFRGPLVLRVGSGAEVLLSQELARCVQVQPL